MKKYNIYMMIFVGSLILFGTPLLTIWCLNTLFPILDIEYSIKTYFAMFMLIIISALNKPMKVKNHES